MSKTEHSFTLGSIKCNGECNFSEEVWSKFNEVLKSNERKYFTIGDVVVHCGVEQAIKCIPALPEDYFKKVLRRIVIPAVKRVTKHLTDPRIPEVIQDVYQYLGNQPIDIVKFREKATSILTDRLNENSLELSFIDKTIDRCFVGQTALLSLVNTLFDSPERKFFSAINILLFDIIASSDPKIYVEQEIKEDIIRTFPPILERFHLYEDAFHNAIIKYKPNWLLKKLGFKDKDGKTFIFKWGSFTKKWGIEFQVCEWDSDCDYDNLWHLSFCFIYGSFSINLPKWLPKHHFNTNFQSDLRNWGILSHDDSLRLGWGQHYKYFYYPWNLTHVRHQVLMVDGTWKDYFSWKGSSLARDNFEANIAKELHTFKYTLKSGVVQNRIATVKVSEMEWRRWFIKWLPIFRMIKRTIDVEFSDEVGERSGSYKGGTMGCSYQLREDEDVLSCLRRMENERNF